MPEITNSPSSSSSASEVSFNEALLTLIFLYLPAKSLCICKCVSKQWRSIITSPYFTRLLIPCFNPASGLLVQRSSRRRGRLHDYVCVSLKSSTPAPFKKLSFVDDPRGLTILQSCNGLLLCCSFRAREPNRSYYIYNPTTQQFVTLLKPAGRKSQIPMVREVKLAFDPWKSPHYKVVCIRSNCFEYYQAEIYSSETKKWRVSGPRFSACHHIPFEYGGVYWNGAIYWPGFWDEYSLRFNVEEEKFEKFPMPCIGGSWDYHENSVAYFGESCGHLHLVPLDCLQRPTVYTVYEMKSDGTEWFLKYQVNICDVAAAFPHVFRHCIQEGIWRYFVVAVLCIVRGEKEEDAFMLLEFPGKVIRYNLWDNTFYKLCDFANSTIDYTQLELDENDDIPVCLEYNRERAFEYIESEFCGI